MIVVEEGREQGANISDVGVDGAAVGNYGVGMGERGLVGRVVGRWL